MKEERKRIEKGKRGRKSKGEKCNGTAEREREKRREGRGGDIRRKSRGKKKKKSRRGEESAWQKHSG